MKPKHVVVVAAIAAMPFLQGGCGGGDGGTKVDSSPAFSPDGPKIAFASTRDANWEIYIMNADGSGQTNLTNNVAYDDVPAFSPDGSMIAFTSYRDGNREIYIMNANGSGQTNLTSNAAEDDKPSFPLR
ncbi:MAG: PD40 domain-containing protein [Armatimonadetes bacterium]|nr:PD40 domain-containing protein [Armatimonadota bacterium]